jgi:hypothetical protein
MVELISMTNTNKNELLLQCILQLPEVLQVYIGMYNVEHRKMMKDICKDIVFYYQELNCHNCDCKLKRIDPEVVSTCGCYEFYYCCIDCFYDERLQ